MTTSILRAVPDAWQAGSSSCDVWSDPPGQVWANVAHGVDELLVPIEGQIELEMDGLTLRAVVAHEVLIPLMWSTPCATRVAPRES